MKKKKVEFFDEVMELPKVSIVLVGIGLLEIIYSFIRLQNPFFLLVGIFAGAVIIKWGYDYWHNRLTDMRVRRNSELIDSIVHPPK